MQSHSNRLHKETSPYLLQHARNPVDWYAWGPEALARAKAENKPILLSIGYSACHWCHVMERESFEDERTASLMNAHFVNIKVDREERPDLDQIYQLVVQLMGRSGGWPLTVFLTPDQKPFFGGTYYPPVPRYGMPSFSQVLVALSDAYRDKPRDIADQADELSAAIAEVGKNEATARGDLTVGLLERAASKLTLRFDDTHGGFGARPKFPNTMALDLLLLHAMTSDDLASKNRVKHALDAMQDGGIHDQLGGGFHRYSTDEKWLVPHFEKMLYDNALLLRLYGNGVRAFGDETYAATARHIVRWLFREMTRADGLFFSAQDADSEGEEGKFFVWTEEEIRTVLSAEDARVAIAFFGVTKEGNFAEPGHAPTGTSVLHRACSIEEVAASLSLSPDEASLALGRATDKLFHSRDARSKPFRDDKVMVSLNALMIGALTDAGMALHESSWIEHARTAFDRLWQEACTQPEDVRVARYLKDEQRVGTGFLDDYAYLADAALRLYEATADPQYVKRAMSLAQAMDSRFRDVAGGLFLASNDGERLIVRTKDSFDHAVPAASAIAVSVFARLGTLVDPKFRLVAEAELRLHVKAAETPLGYASTLFAIDALARGFTEVVVLGADDSSAALLDAAAQVYLPHPLLARVDLSEPSSVAVCALLLEGKTPQEHPVAYVCRAGACSQPVATPATLTALLRDLRN